MREVISAVDEMFSDQLPYACARALTDTARAVADAMPAEMQQDLDRPTQFTQRAMYVTPARKDNLEAVAGIKDAQAKYLGYQIEGGERMPSRRALRLPANVQLDAFGNLPAGLIRQLIARAKAGKRTTKGQAKKSGVSQALDLFYGEPPDGRPAGIYKRVVLGPGRHQLVPIVVFPKRGATYRPRFKFEEAAHRVADAEFPLALDRWWTRAKATAR